jgi:hypothetical protein
MLLTARPADFQGIHASAYSRGAKLLVAFLQETRGEEFAYYYDAVREGLPEPDTFLNPAHESDRKALESDWLKWLQDQK